MKNRKSFNEIYTEIASETNDFFVELARRQNKSFLISIFVGLAICILLYKTSAEKSAFVMFVIFLIVVFLGIVINNTIYRNRYKQEIIGRFVKKYDDKLYYLPKGRVITKHDYYMSRFDKTWNELECEDGIQGKLEDGSIFRLSQVTVINKVTTSIDGYSDNVEKQVKFKGTFCIIELANPINNTIELIGNARINRFNKSRIEVDSEEFEKEYDLMARDRIQALRIFTPDIIERLIGIKEKTKSPFRVKIEGSYIFIRISNGDIFEPISYEGKISPKAFMEYYNTLDVPMTIAEAIVDGSKELY